MRLLGSPPSGRERFGVRPREAASTLGSPGGLADRVPGIIAPEAQLSTIFVAPNTETEKEWSISGLPAGPIQRRNPRSAGLSS